MDTTTTQYSVNVTHVDDELEHCGAYHFAFTCNGSPVVESDLKVYSDDSVLAALELALTHQHAVIDTFFNMGLDRSNTLALAHQYRILDALKAYADTFKLYSGPMVSTD